MSAPDFEISAGLQARQLLIHVMSEAELAEVGDAVTVTTREARSGFPSPPEQGTPHTDISIEKHTIAVMPSQVTSLHDQPRTGGVQHDG